MDRLACNMESLLEKKLGIYSELSSLLKAETDSIIKMDINALWSASSRKKAIASDIISLRESILSLLHENQVIHSMENRTFDLDTLIAILPLSSKIKADLEIIKIKIKVKKEIVRQLASSNRKCINEYLGVIDGVISTITGSSKQELYGKKGVAGSRISSSYGTGYGRRSAVNIISGQV